MLNKVRTILFLSVLMMHPTIMAQGVPAAWWKSNGPITLNSQPVTEFQDSTILIDNIYSEGTLVFVATFKKGSSARESALWHMESNDSLLYGLTTENILAGGHAMRYRQYRTTGPIVNTTQLTLPKELAGTPCALYAGATDSLQSDALLAEVMCFDRQISDSQLLSIQSYMALKYGAMLGKVDYLDGNGDVIWNYTDNKAYHHRVGGVGTDTVYGLYQTSGRNQCDSSILTIFSDTLGPGEYVLAGDNGAALDFIEADGVRYLARQWKIQATNKTDDLPMVDIYIDTALISHAGADSLELMIGGLRYRPNPASGGLLYRHIMLPSDTSYIRFAKGLPSEEADMAHQESGGPGAPSAEGTIDTQIRVFPNPTSGRYSILVTGADEADVQIYDSKGSQVNSYHGANSQIHMIEGVLPPGQTYYVVVRTDKESETIKLITQ